MFTKQRQRERPTCRFKSWVWIIFLKMGLQMFQTKVMQCEVCQRFVYTFGASALQLPEELSQNSHYSTTVTNMVNAGAYPGSPK